MPLSLADKSCTPCRGGIPPLTEQEAAAYHPQAPEWGLLDDATRIERTYRFKNFGEAFAFVARAAELAEAEGHHPDIGFGWGYATVSLRTKKIKGLHENDFIMAHRGRRRARARASKSAHSHFLKSVVDSAGISSTVYPVPATTAVRTDSKSPAA